LTKFPQLVDGRIVRYESIAKELVSRTLSCEIFWEGFKRFTFGLAKKLLIADACGKIADAAFSFPNAEVTALAAWVGMFCYTLQIYFDFSGYSDMAIGLGRIFGFTFPENFNYPYISKSISEFWRRWHMTLSGWFKDYLYIPMGGVIEKVNLELALTCLLFLLYVDFGMELIGCFPYGVSIMVFS
uniref:MBOAT family O-acyltransferase n=1 Tax=Succinivibrio sp. TaxID=2053619 RepID=UPI00402A99AA